VSPVPEPIEILLEGGHGGAFHIPCKPAFRSQRGGRDFSLIGIMAFVKPWYALPSGVLNYA